MPKASDIRPSESIIRDKSLCVDHIQPGLQHILCERNRHPTYSTSADGNTPLLQQPKHCVHFETFVRSMNHTWRLSRRVVVTRKAITKTNVYIYVSYLCVVVVSDLNHFMGLLCWTHVDFFELGSLLWITSYTTLFVNKDHIGWIWLCFHVDWRVITKCSYIVKYIVRSYTYTDKWYHESNYNDKK